MAVDQMQGTRNQRYGQVGHSVVQQWPPTIVFYYA